MANNLIKGTITLIDDSLHNLDYHELKMKKGRLCLKLIEP